MSAFDTGDIVVLKSGGPRMTVRSVQLKGGFSLVNCDWFGPDHGAINHHEFRDEEIALADGGQSAEQAPGKATAKAGGGFF